MPTEQEVQAVSDAIRGIIFRDKQTGATLHHTYGRGKGGISHYYLRVPGRERATHIKAWGNEQAVEIAKTRLAKYSDDKEG